MESSKLTLVGGQLIVTSLSSKLDDRTYDIGKAHAWLKLINGYQRPTKWLKATKKGTKVDFELIKTQESKHQSFDELEIYLRQINRKHNLDITLHGHKEAN